MILPRALLLVILATVPLVRGQDVAAIAIANLTDPAKLGTLSGDRPANPRLKKAVYWLAARGGQDSGCFAIFQRL